MKDRLHLTWTNELPRGICPHCNEKTTLILASGLWNADEESCKEQGIEYPEDGVMVHEEVSGHYCRNCDVLTSLSINR
jgi:hypothetical protein